jgi:hypothetical protein
LTQAITHRPLLAKGPKVKHPPRDAAAQIEAMAADGFSKLGIAKRLKTSPDVLNRWLEENPALQDAFNQGRENERWTLHNILFKQAIAGNATAAMFLLKARHGYREGDQAESGNKVQINFQLPGALPMDVFKTMKVLEHEPINRGESVSEQRPLVPRGS